MNKYTAAIQIVRQRLLGLLISFILWLVFLAFVGKLNLWTGVLSFLVVFAGSFFGAFMRVNKNMRAKKK